MNTSSSRVLLIAVLSVVGLLSGCAASDSSDPDSMQLEDLFSSKDDQRALASCMQDLGWDSEFNSDDGSIKTPVTEDQNAAYERDMKECLRDVGIDAGGELSTEEYDLAFEWYSEIAECLSSAGWEVPPTPTRQTFESTYDSNPWIPWSLVPAEEMTDARKACPTLNAPQQ